MQSGLLLCMVKFSPKSETTTGKNKNQLNKSQPSREFLVEGYRNGTVRYRTGDLTVPSCFSDTISQEGKCSLLRSATCYHRPGGRVFHALQGQAVPTNT